MGCQITLDASTDNPTWQALAIGLEAPASAACLREFLTTCASLSLQQVNTAAEAITLLEQGSQAPDLLIIVQSWPQQYPDSQCQRLLHLAPLARRVCCYSPWCESEGRNCSSWPLAIRVPMDAAVWRLQQEIRVLNNSAAPLPITAGRDEAFAFQSQPGLGMPPQIAVSIQTRDRGLSQTYRQLFRHDGHCPPAALADVILWDIDPWNERTRRWGLDLQAQAPRIPIVGWSYWSHHMPQAGSPCSTTSPVPHLAAMAPKLSSVGQLADTLHPHAREGQPAGHDAT